jgi:hypothetical protein
MPETSYPFVAERGDIVRPTPERPHTVLCVGVGYETIAAYLYDLCDLHEVDSSFTTAPGIVRYALSNFFVHVTLMKAEQNTVIDVSFDFDAHKEHAENDKKHVDTAFKWFFNSWGSFYENYIAPLPSEV